MRIAPPILNPDESASAVVRHFSSYDRAHRFLAQWRWPCGAVCPRCGTKDVRYLADYRRFQCKRKHIGRQFSLKTGTFMDRSNIGIEKWATVLWLELNGREMSSRKLSSLLGITQKSALRLLQLVRAAVAASKSPAQSP